MGRRPTEHLETELKFEVGLDFVLPDFTRLSWVSDPAREVWEPRLGRITKAWFEIEWLAILSGVRRCGVTVTSPEDLITKGGEWVKRGLSALPLEIQGFAGSYSSTAQKAQLGEPFVYRIVIGASPDLAAFKAAWDAGDNQEIGRLLGYPPCCLAFFQAVWVDQIVRFPSGFSLASSRLKYSHSFPSGG